MLEKMVKVMVWVMVIWAVVLATWFAKSYISYTHRTEQRAEQLKSNGIPIADWMTYDGEVVNIEAIDIVDDVAIFEITFDDGYTTHWNYPMDKVDDLEQNVLLGLLLE